MKRSFIEVKRKFIENIKFVYNIFFNFFNYLVVCLVMVFCDGSLNMKRGIYRRKNNII